MNDYAQHVTRWSPLTIAMATGSVSVYEKESVGCKSFSSSLTFCFGQNSVPRVLRQRVVGVALPGFNSRPGLYLVNKVRTPSLKTRSGFYSDLATTRENMVLTCTYIE